MYLQHDVIIDGQPKFLPINFTTLPQLLKKAGYATHMVGKYVRQSSPLTTTTSPLTTTVHLTAHHQCPPYRSPPMSTLPLTTTVHLPAHHHWPPHRQNKTK